MRALGIIFLMTLFAACSSTRLVSEWENPDIELFRAGKVLVVGITSDTVSRIIFERQLSRSLISKGVLAQSSYEMGLSGEIEEDFSPGKIKALQKQWASQGFDAILVSKITGQESRKSVVQSARGIMDDFQSFSDYYASSREVYGRPGSESYRVYNAESSVFCICPDQDRNLVWRGRIDIVEPYNSKRNIRDYVRTLTAAMADKNILFGQ